MNLRDKSIEVILEHQTDSGAYLASPNFPTYQFCWFRDGAYIAYSMDLVGEHDSSRRFHTWVAQTLNSRSDVVENAVKKAGLGLQLDEEDVLHTRYTEAGEATSDGEWPNHQLDGFGTWLWALGEHLDLTDSVLVDEWERAADLVAAYLTALWETPCFDCWEEHPNEVHTYTLATIHGGLATHQRLTGADHEATLAAIVERLQAESLTDGHYVKYPGSDVVDASLLGLAVPFRVVDPLGPEMIATVEEIESTLRSGSGVHRYPGDTYYGGGEWLVLTSWLAWYYRSVGQLDKADEANRWVENRATSEGFLPEQAPENLIDPDCLEPWVSRWGDIATPLLWSHAKYLIALS